MRDLLYFVIGILLGLICIFFDGSVRPGPEHQHRLLAQRRLDRLSRD